MKIAGFNFTKISIERLLGKMESPKINMNIDISELKKVNNSIINSEETFLSITFTYKLSYAENIAEISINGNILLSLEGSLAEEVLKKWETKEMPAEFKTNLYNFILRKTMIKALQLEEEIGLPPHVPLPSIKISEEGEKKE